MYDRTHFDGVEVIERSVPTRTHIAPGMAGKPGMALTGVTELLLADGRNPVVCDDCYKEFDNANSAGAHRTTHNPATHAPDTPLETIKTVVRLVRQFEQESHRGKCEKAAAELNRRDVRPAHADRWTAATVSRIYTRYKSEVNVRVPRAAPAVTPTATSRRTETTPRRAAGAPTLEVTRRRPKVVALSASGALDGLVARGVELTQRVDTLNRDLTELQRELTTYVQALAEALTRVTECAPEVLEKAEKWDKMQALMR